MSLIIGGIIAEIENGSVDCDGLIAEIEIEECNEVEAPITIEEEDLNGEIESNELLALIEQYPIINDASNFDTIFEKLINKNQPNGYAGLNANGKLPSSLFAYDYYNEDFTLNFTQISNKKIILSKNPIFPESVIVQPVGALPQRYGVDYVVVSNEVQWAGLGLDGFLNDLGEVVRVSYKSED